MKQNGRDRQNNCALFIWKERQKREIGTQELNDLSWVGKSQQQPQQINPSSLLPLLSTHPSNSNFLSLHCF